jgi:hypothetical protein
MSRPPGSLHSPNRPGIRRFAAPWLGDWGQSPLPNCYSRDYRCLPNKLRIRFAASILRAGCGMADQNWPTHVSDGQGDADRRGNSSLVEDGRFWIDGIERPRNHLVVPPTRRGVCGIQRKLHEPALVRSYSKRAATVARLAWVTRSISSRAESKDPAKRQRQRDFFVPVLSPIFR